ncbi:hypothetical protein MBLNU230_g0818t1 [Neophaeotheca triangularis]
MAAASDDLIDFNVIESHKENIQALPSGRSARALHQLYSPPILGANPSPATQDAHSAARQEFEKELQNIDEADDPLEVYDRYVKWTLDAYPSAQSTPQSQLLPLLERATKAFQASPTYKNDARYLRMWLHYIRLFSDAPREVFVFLARQGIGEGLALYYEEFAAWLENAGRWNQAEEIYKMGIEKEARPGERLLRKFGEFQKRKEEQQANSAEPSSPALPMVRPALAAKMDPFASASPSAAQTQQAQSTAPRKAKSSKMAIFSDGDEPARPDSGGSNKGWDSIGSLSNRKKENSTEAKPWAGEKLGGAKINAGMQKMAIFKDETGRRECVFVNLEALYPQPGQEYCFEELRARHRGWLDVDWNKERPSSSRQDTETTTHLEPPAPVSDENFEVSQPSGNMEQPKAKKQRGFQIFEDQTPSTANTKSPSDDDKVLVESFSKTLALNDENDENKAPSKQEADLAKKLRREERANRTRKIQVMDVKHIKNETKTIQLNMESPAGPKVKRKKSSDRAEPTMTINTKEAMDEIYGIFNQPLEPQAEQSEDEEDEDSDEDYASGGESTGTGKLSGAGSDYGDETRNEILGTSRATQAAEEDRTEHTGWSDFTTSKHVPQEVEDLVDTDGERDCSVYRDHENEEAHPEEVATPRDEVVRTRYVPLPPEDFEPPTSQYRDQAIVANNRLPFMTPIVEQTESSVGAATARAGVEYYDAKTPSRKTGKAQSIPEDEADELCSSPFQDATAEMAEEKRKVLQPVRTKSTKGTISLGQGSAKSQIAARTEPEAPELPQKGPIVKDAQCNPMDPYIRETILSHLKPSLSTYEGYHEDLRQNSGRTPEVRKFIKALSKASRSRAAEDKTNSALAVPPTLCFHGSTYKVKRELGAGTFAPVYLVENCSVADAMAAEDERAISRVGKAAHRKPLEAVKMEDPPSTWEFYILRQSHRRLGVSRPSESIVRAHEMHLYRDECFLIEEYRDQGTLLDLVNVARAENSTTGGGGGGGGGMDETLAMFFTIELFRTVEALHAKGIIHGDLKGDNVLVRFDDPGQETDWSPRYFPSGAHGWASKGVCLIDFGRGIDMQHFDPNVAFIADWKTSEADCAEMRELRPWTYQIDYHGLAGIVHSLLFGKYMETLAERGGGDGLGQRATKTYRIREALKRYWQTEIWGEVFALLLNPGSRASDEVGARMPVLGGLRACRERMEAWLEENCERGLGLKGTIGRMDAVVREKRRRGRAAV